jgi:hypothetical protein
MSHTFFESNTYITVENTDVGDNSQFICECSYAPDTTQLDLVFDPSEDYYAELTEKLDSGEWEHFIARIQIKYNDMVMAERHLGSCVAPDVAKWFEQDTDGVVDEMIRDAIDEAEQECRKLLGYLQEDFG